MKNNQISISVRRRIIQAHREEKNWKELAKTLGINKKTEYHWLQNDQELPKLKGGSSSKKTPEMIEMLKEAVENNATIITLAELTTIVFQTST